MSTDARYPGDPRDDGASPSEPARQGASRAELNSKHASLESTHALPKGPARLLAEAIMAHGRIHAGALKWLSSAAHVAEGVALGAFSEAELAELGIALYDRTGIYASREPFAWEPGWFEASLPKAPARVLVGACGGGVEMAWLLERGFDVVGFDASRKLVDAARVRLAKHRASARLVVARYETLGDRDVQRALCGEAQGFDAVLMGWGSISHVPTEAERGHVLERLSDLCPTGPILASGWSAGHPAAIPAPSGQGFAMGKRLGRLLRGGRRQAPDSTNDGAGYLRFLPHVGYVAVLDPEELARHASRLGRRLELHDDPRYTYFTLHPR